MKAISTDVWTYNKMLTDLPAESLFELRDFNLIEMPSPKRIHQRVVKFVTKQIDNYVESQNLGEVFIAPFDVIFDRGNVCQPDIIFLSKQNQMLSTEGGIMGAPDLLIEVVSKGSVVRDYIEKKNDYEAFGVQEYWLIDPLSETIIVYALNNGKYDLFSSVEESGTAHSKLLAGFSLNFEEVFVVESQEL